MIPFPLIYIIFSSRSQDFLSRVRNDNPSFPFYILFSLGKGFIVSSLLKITGKKDNIDLVFVSVLHRIRSSSCVSGTIGHADGTIIHQMPIPFLHAAWCIFLLDIHHFIRLRQYPLIVPEVLPPPSPGLIPTRQYHNQSDMWELHSKL